MSNELKMYHLALIKLYEDFENDCARNMVALAHEALSDDEKDLISLTCNAEVHEIIY